MDIVGELWKLEGFVKSAEQKLLDRKPAETREIIESLSDTTLGAHIPIEEVLDRLQNTKAEDYVSYSFSGYLQIKWDEYDEGYKAPYFHWSSTRTDRSFLRYHLWYMEMTNHYSSDSHSYPDFVSKVAFNFGWNIKRDGETFDGFSELFALSLLRKHMRKLWERLVIDIIRTRHKTQLESVAKLLKLRLSWVYGICGYAKEREGISGKPVRDEMVFLCTDPDYDVVPLVNLPEPPEAKVVYLVVCPNCRHRNEQGRTTCENCNAPL